MMYIVWLICQMIQWQPEVALPNHPSDHVVETITYWNHKETMTVGWRVALSHVRGPV